MTTRVCLAGATGWAGSALARAISHTDDITVSAAVARTHAGRTLGEVLGEARLDCRILATATEALAQPCDVFFEFTRPEVARANVLAALGRGANVVIGTSGLSEDDFHEIGAAAELAKRAVLAVGNFALTVVLLQRFAEIAARFIPQWEIIDYASDAKPDAPSGTVRELAHRLGRVRTSELTVPLQETQGVRETRGARMNGSQVHSVRLPGYTISAEVIFGMPNQQLSLRHDSGSGAEPYVDGALLAIREVHTLTGLQRGLDSVLNLDEQARMPIIQSERLLIRAFEPDDLSSIHRILGESFDAVPSPDQADALRRRESWLRWASLSQEWLPELHQPPYGDRAIVLKSTGALIGAIGYVPLLAPFDQIPELGRLEFSASHYTPEVGLYWVIDRVHRRHGFAAEAARRMVDLAFAELRLARILATTEHDNVASQGVMRRLGMQIVRNPLPEPTWLQVVGVLWHPG